MKPLDLFTKFEALELSREELQASFTVAKLLKPHLRPERVMEAVAFLLSEPVVSTPARPARLNAPEKTRKNGVEEWRYHKSQGRPGYFWQKPHTMTSHLPRIKGKEVRVPGMWMPDRKGKKIAYNGHNAPRKYADPKVLGPAIRQSLQDRGMDVSTLAEKIGTTTGPIYDWMNGKKLPRRETFDRLTQELNLQVEVRA